MQRIEYIMDWASPLFVNSVHDLASSGLPEKYLAVPMQSRDSEWCDRSGHECMTRLKELISANYSVKPEQVALTMGASGGIFLTALIMHQMKKPVVIETPVYEPIWRGYEAIGTEMKWLTRRRDEKYSLKNRIDEAKELTKDASCLVITNPNNPTGVYDNPETIRELAEAIKPAYLLINEAYQPMIDGTSSAYGVADNVFVMQTMTKSYAVCMPRIGWVIAPLKFSSDIHAASVLTIGGHSSTSSAFIIPIIENLDQQRLQARAHLKNRHDIVYKAIDEHPRINWHEPPRNVIIGSIKIDGVDDDLEFCRKIFDDYKIVMAPGRFFREPGTIRLGFGAFDEKFYNGFDIFLKYANEY